MLYQQMRLYSYDMFIVIVYVLFHVVCLVPRGASYLAISSWLHPPRQEGVEQAHQCFHALALLKRGRIIGYFDVLADVPMQRLSQQCLHTAAAEQECCTEDRGHHTAEPEHRHHRQTCLMHAAWGWQSWYEVCQMPAEPQTRSGAVRVDDQRELVSTLPQAGQAERQTAKQASL